MDTQGSLPSEVLRIVRKWSGLDMQLVQQPIIRTTQPVLHLLDRLLSDTQHAAFEKYDMQPKEQEDQQLLQDFSNTLVAIGRLSFLVGFDFVITGRMPILDNKTVLEAPIIQNIPPDGLHILKEIGRPAVAVLVDAAELWSLTLPEGSPKGDQLGDLITKQVMALLLGCFTIGAMEATIKMRDIPVDHE